jgi:Delta7-sterol 5-desaturase
LMHHPRIYKYIHAEHHKSVDVNPFTSLSFHFLEPFILTFWVFPLSFLMPMYAPAVGVVQLWGLLENIKSHLGYEFYPKWFNNSWLRFMTTSTHHNMHHSKFNGNYGIHFRIWDRLFGTEFKEYEGEFEAIKKRVEN